MKCECGGNYVHETWGNPVGIKPRGGGVFTAIEMLVCIDCGGERYVRGIVEHEGNDRFWERGP